MVPTKKRLITSRYERSKEEVNLQKKKKMTKTIITRHIKTTAKTVALWAAMATMATPAFADDNSDGNTNTENGSTSIAEDLKNKAGFEMSYDNRKSFLTTGQPQDDASKVFIIYNVGTGKFLSLGGYWGTHSMLSDIPQLLWMQRRNENKNTSYSYLRYPETADDVTEVTSEDSYINAIVNLSPIQVGWAEGKQTHAKYNYVRVVDNTSGSVVQNIFGDGSTPYQPTTKEYKELSDFDISTQSIEASIDLSTCSADKVVSDGKEVTNDENILSLGSMVEKWYQGSSKNIHMYFAMETKQLNIQYVDKSNPNGDIKRGFSNVDTTKPLTVKLSKDGIFVNGEKLAFDHMPNITYDADLAGDIVRFKKNSNGSYALDNNGYYIIDQENGSGLLRNFYNYVYADESKSEKRQTYFISSRFTKSNPQDGEGNFLGRTSYVESLKNVYGSIGIYGDRAVEPGTTESVQWSFDKVDGRSDNVYTISLTYTAGKKFGEEVLDADAEYGFTAQETTLTENKQLFLQATSDFVKSGNLKDENNGNYFNYPDGDNQNLSFVEALDKTPADNGYAYWKVFTVEEYYDMLRTKKSSTSTDKGNISFLISDNSFNKENSNLKNWKMEGLYPNIKFGIDKFYKKNTTDEAYVNEWNSIATANNWLNTRARYFGVMAGNGARGRIYQDVILHQSGWYTLQCGGMTNINARLFVEHANSSDGNVFSAPVTKQLAEVTSEDIEQYKGKVMGWPYSEGLPMYNALVDINDTEMGVTEKYKNQLRFFIGTATNEKPVKIRLGVMIYDEDEPYTGVLSEEGIETEAAESNATVATEDEWTVFDDFQLLFDGTSDEPDLVLNENFTDLSYIEDAAYEYNLRPLHLERTFTAGKWNTLVLPVALSESQVKAAFGENTKLARLQGITDNSMRFVYEEPSSSGVLLRAYRPYIIKPEIASGNTKEYEVIITMKNGSKQTLQLTKDHFDIGSVILGGKVEDSDGNISYPISETYPNYITSSQVADASLGTVTMKGTLCKTFETKTAEEGGNSKGFSIISGRPDLKNVGAYIIKNNVMYRVPDDQQYGMKGLRCWFEYTEPTNAAAPASMKLSINGIEDITDSINDIETADGCPTVEKFADGVFSLNGLRIADANDWKRLPHGIYIVNGKKVVK